MEEGRIQFQQYLEKRDIVGAIQFIKSLLKQGIEMEDIYKSMVVLTMKEIGLPDNEEKFDIVTEHLYSNMIRTVIENCFKQIEESVTTKKEKIVLVCSVEGEMHELSVRVAQDYFRLAGYSTIFLGCNVPTEDILEAIQKFSPDYVALSITNFYFLTRVKEVVASIHSQSQSKVILGGQAVENNYDFGFVECQADFVVRDLEEIKKLEELI